MIKKIEWKWETIDKHDDGAGNMSMTARCKVIGGWLVHHTFQKKNCMSESMQFVPDSYHEWTIIAPFDPSNPGTTHKPKVNPDDFASAS